MCYEPQTMSHGANRSDASAKGRLCRNSASAACVPLCVRCVVYFVACVLCCFCCECPRCRPPLPLLSVLPQWQPTPQPSAAQRRGAPTAHSVRAGATDAAGSGTTQLEPRTRARANHSAASGDGWECVRAQWGGGDLCRCSRLGALPCLFRSRPPRRLPFRPESTCPVVMGCGYSVDPVSRVNLDAMRYACQGNLAALQQLAASGAPLRLDYALTMEQSTHEPVLNVFPAGMQAIHVAAKRGHLPVVQWLLACRPDLVHALVPSDNSTAINMAAQGGFAEIVEWSDDGRMARMRRRQDASRSSALMCCPPVSCLCAYRRVCACVLLACVSQPPQLRRQSKPCPDWRHHTPAHRRAKGTAEDCATSLGTRGFH